MPCLKAPAVPEPPALPAPLSAKAPPIATPSFDPSLCCKMPPLPVKRTNLPLPPILLDPAITLLKSATKAINSYLDGLALKCPRE